MANGGVGGRRVVGGGRPPREELDGFYFLHPEFPNVGVLRISLRERGNDEGRQKGRREGRVGSRRTGVEDRSLCEAKRQLPCAGSAICENAFAHL